MDISHIPFCAIADGAANRDAAIITALTLPFDIFNLEYVFIFFFL
jgi:hypothetical protein